MKMIDSQQEKTDKVCTLQKAFCVSKVSNPESLIMLFAIVWTEKVQNWKKNLK